ncbi:MAG: hypothetical protein WD184_02525 [Acidimicrobiia bacterium]
MDKRELTMLASDKRGALRILVLIASALIVVGAILVVLQGSGASQRGFHGSIALMDRISATDAVVVVDLGEHRDGPREGDRLVDATVLSVPYQFGGSGSRFPTLQPGDVLTIADRLEFGTHSLTSVPEGDVVLLVTYHGEDSFAPELIGMWHPDVVARDTADGLEFFGAAARSGHYADEVASLRRYLVSMDSGDLDLSRHANEEVALLTSWVQELREGAGLGGPISTAFLAPERRQFDAEVAWDDEG